MQEMITKVEDILKKELKDEMNKVVVSGKFTPEIMNSLCKGSELMSNFLDLEEKLYGGNSYGYSMNDGYSNRRGRSMTTGRYVSRDMDPMMRSYAEEMYPGRRSYDNGYSGHSIKDRAIARLESMYDEAKTDHERKMLDGFISQLESAR